MRYLSSSCLSRPVRLRGGQGIDDIHGRGEAHRVALQAGGVAQGGGQMGLAQSDPAEEDHVGLVLDELQAEQLLDLKTVDLTRPTPLELLQGLDDREACLADAPLDTAFLAQQRLAGDEAGEKLDIAPVRLGGLFGQRGVVLADKEQLQIGELRIELLRRGGLLGRAHGVSSCCAVVGS